MSSKSNNILPSTGTNIGLGTASGTVNVDALQGSSWNSTNFRTYTRCSVSYTEFTL